MSFIQILVSLVNGLLDIILAIPRLLLWLFELFSATSKAEIARPVLVSIEAELKNNGLLKDFTNELKGVANIKLEAPIILENSKNDNISNNKDLFLDYVSAKSASPDYPLDRFSIDFAMFGKSSEFLFMVIAAVLFIWISGFFFKSVWRYSYKTINHFKEIVLLAAKDLSPAILANYLFSLVFLGLGWNFLFISGTSLLVLNYKEEERFRAQGFNDFIVFSIQATASLTAGIVLSFTSWKIMNILCIPFLIIIIFTTLRADRLLNKTN